MTQSGSWEIWHKGDASHARHLIGKYPSQHEADKAWKRLEIFDRTGRAHHDHEMLVPTVKQQLELKESQIKAKYQPSAGGESRPFNKILMDKIDQKRKRYAYLEKEERLKPHISFTYEKTIIEGAIRALRWANTEWMNAQQLELVK